MPKKEVTLPRFPADFEAHLRFLTPEEGGRQGPVYQGYHPDIRYDGDGNELRMVWPVFIAEDGSIIEEDIPIRGQVYARMYVVVDEIWITFHRQRVHEGLKFFVHEGSHVVAEGVVTQILALHQNR